MGVVSRYNKGKKKKTNLSLGAGEGRGEGRENVREGKVASHSCCLRRCRDATPRHHIMTIIGLATKALLAQLVTTLVMCLVISI